MASGRWLMRFRWELNAGVGASDLRGKYLLDRYWSRGDPKQTSILCQIVCN